MHELHDVWIYLSANPLLHLTLTLAAWQVARKIHQISGGIPLLNPVLVSVVLLVALLMITRTDYHQYFQGAQFVHFLLGPATVALAIPLYRQVRLVRQSALALAASLLCGSAAAVASALLIGHALGADSVLLASLAPKSVTTPVAMGITERLGGLPSLTAVMVILTGIIGAAVGPTTLKLARVHDHRAQGLALGTAAHALGTARALQISEVAGAFSGLAMGTNALATAVALPLLWTWLF